MVKAGEPRDKGIGFHSRSAIRDLVVVIIITISAGLISYFFNVFDLIIKFLQKHPEKIFYIDEVVVTLVTLSIGLSLFAWRRWLELKKETTERIRNQEELLKFTTTQAETEKIINRQLHIDMDQMKQDVRGILTLLLNRNKGPV